MELKLIWSKPLQLKPIKGEMGYIVDLEKISSESGVYIFGRKYGKLFEALYVGKANNLKARIKGQLNNRKLAAHISKSSNGSKLLLFAEFDSKPGQQAEKCIKIAERALIRYFLAEDHDLVNKQGTRLSHHTIVSMGQHPKKYFSKKISIDN